MIVKESLGRGSYGMVYHIEVDKLPYALKRVKLSEEASYGKTTFSEAKNYAYLLKQCTGHPNIIRYCDSLSTCTNFYLLMEYAGKRTLNELSTPLTNYKQLVNIIIQICLGLLHLKKKKVVHRDIKSVNILITEGGLLKIADFGISCRLMEDMFASTCLGTPFYTAPYIIDQKPYSYAVDVWSFGVILYEMCHGGMPFRGNDIEALKQNIKHQYPQISKKVHKDIRRAITMCLVKDPTLRATPDRILRLPLIVEQMKSYIANPSRYF